MFDHLFAILFRLSCFHKSLILGTLMTLLAVAIILDVLFLFSQVFDLGYSHDSISRSYSIRRTVPKNSKNLYLTYSMISRCFFITCIFFKKHLLNVKYNLKNQGLNILMIVSCNRVMRVHNFIFTVIFVLGTFFFV